MSTLGGGTPIGRDHDRARELAPARPDGYLTTEEAAWLDRHLAGCPACASVAAAYGAQRHLFQPARDVMPAAPRDLWARTAATIEVEARGRRGAARPSRRLGGWAYAPLAGAVVVAIAVGTGLLNGLPAPESTSNGRQPNETPMAFDAGEVVLVTSGDDGTLEVRRQTVDEVCPEDPTGCGLNPTTEVTQTEQFAMIGRADAYISPDEGQMVVIQRGEGTQDVYMVPVRPAPDASATPGVIVTPSPDVPTPTPTPPVATATAPPAASPSPVESASPTASPSSSQPASAEPSPMSSGAPSVDPSPSAPVPSVEPSPSTAASPSADPSPSVDASPSADASPSVEPSSSADATTSPQASPAPTASSEPSPEPTASIEVTPRPDGAIEIAKDVILVGSAAAYSENGERFAFSARPADGSAGPDVYVWESGDGRATAVTTDGGSLFAGWLGDELLVSRVVDESPRTTILSLDSGDERAAGEGPMWRPTVAPDASTAAWWDGSLRMTDDGLSWLPDEGRLVLDRWQGGDGDGQVLAETGITDWQVGWSDDGSAVAVWTSTGDPDEAGTLTLYDVDPETGRAKLSTPRMEGEQAFEGFSIQDGRLTWSAPADEGDTTVQVLAWSGDRQGRLEILTEGGTRVVR